MWTAARILLLTAEGALLLGRPKNAGTDSEPECKVETIGGSISVKEANLGRTVSVGLMLAKTALREFEEETRGVFKLDRLRLLQELQEAFARGFFSSRCWCWSCRAWGNCGVPDGLPNC